MRLHLRACGFHDSQGGSERRVYIQMRGIEQVRVLTVTTSEQRIDTMLDALREVTNGKGSDLFLFAHEEVLRSNGPLEAEWISGKGACVRLTD